MSLIQNLEQLDKEFTLLVNQWSCHYTDWFWQFMSNRLVWIPLYIFLIYLLFRKFGWKRGMLMLAFGVGMILVTDQFCNFVKDSVARFRPCHDTWMVENGLRLLERHGSKYGFFPGHSANSFALAAFFTLVFKKKAPRRMTGCLLYGWAAAVAVSRIFVGKHFFGDITVGAVVGIILGLAFAGAALAITEKVWPSPSGFHGSPSPEE